MWFYASTATSSRTGGHPAILPTAAELERVIRGWDSKKQATSFSEKILFDMRTTLLPDVGKFQVTADNLAKMKWRPAGPKSLQRAASAAAFLIARHKSNFKHVERTWAGTDAGATTPEFHSFTVLHG